MSLDSGLRPPIGGYSSLYSDYVAPLIDSAGVVNHAIPTPTVQYFTWREEVEFQPPDNNHDELDDRFETDSE
jgi:hypothetical protein